MGQKGGRQLVGSVSKNNVLHAIGLPRVHRRSGREQSQNQGKQLKEKQQKITQECQRRKENRIKKNQCF